MIKQLLVDCLRDGTPWALRVTYFVEAEDPESGELQTSRRIREVQFTDLPPEVLTAAQALLAHAPEAINTAIRVGAEQQAATEQRREEAAQQRAAAIAAREEAKRLAEEKRAFLATLEAEPTPLPGDEVP